MHQRDEIEFRGWTKGGQMILQTNNSDCQQFKTFTQIINL